jgi:hypothetical protein
MEIAVTTNGEKQKWGGWGKRVPSSELASGPGPKSCSLGGGGMPCGVIYGLQSLWSQGVDVKSCVTQCESWCYPVPPCA